MYIGRRTLHSDRLRMRRIDKVFETLAKVVIVCYGLSTFLIWLSHLPSLTITQIEISGVRAIDANDVIMIAQQELQKKFFRLVDRRNSFLYPRRSLLASVRELDARVARVDIAAKNGKTLAIEIEEHLPEYLWCKGDGATESASLGGPCYFMNHSGYIFARAPEYAGYPFRVYRIPLGGKEDAPIGFTVLPKEEWDLVNEFSGALGTIGLVVHEIVSTGEHDYELRSNALWKILWASTREPSQAVEYLARVLSSLSDDNEDMSAISVIDLRFGNKIFYK